MEDGFLDLLKHKEVNIDLHARINTHTYTHTHTHIHTSRHAHMQAAGIQVAAAFCMTSIPAACCICIDKYTIVWTCK